jgi:single-strand DNA-binding protein
MLNKAILIGHLGQDPEIRTSKTDKRIATLSLATSKRWKDRDTGEQRDQTNWHRVVVFQPHLVDVCEKYLHKGSKVYLEGEILTRKYEDKGENRYVTEIVLGAFHAQLILLDRKEGGAVPEGNDEDYAGYC